MCKKKMLLMEGIQLQIELSSGKTVGYMLYCYNVFFNTFFYSNSNFSFSSTYSGLINIMMLTLQNLFF